MRAHEFELDEIVRMPQGDFAGGKDTLQRDEPEEPSDIRRLPGDSQFVYNVEDRHGPLVINIYDPTSEDTWTPKAQLMVDDAGLQGLDNAVAVNMITVNEDYRGAGLARALYGIVLSILRRPLVAGDSQTPGGRRMWIMLDNIPGVVVRGLWAVQNDQLERPDVQALLKRPGLKVIGQGNYYTFVAFPIEHGKNEIKSLIRGLPLYHGEDPKYTTSMIATWHGQ